jgi:group I intron endonuclease
LELFPEVVTQENNKNLLDLEDFYLKSLLPDYNILTEAGSSFGYKHTEVSRLQMKSVYSEERRKKIGELNKGKTFSPETIEAMKQAALIRKNPIFSEEAILNLKKTSKAILVKELSSGIIYGRYPSMTEAALALNCSSKTIQRSLKSPSKQLKRRWIVYYD